MRRVADYWVDAPLVDLAVSLLFGGLVLLLDPHNVPRADFAASWYQTLAALSGAFLGLGGATATLMFAGKPSERLRVVHESVGSRLVRTVLSCLGGLAAGTVGFVLLYLLPESSDPFGLVLGGALGVFVVLRLARLWWVFRRLLVALVTSDGELNEEEDGGWVKPQVEPSDYRLGKRFF